MPKLTLSRAQWRLSTRLIVAMIVTFAAVLALNVLSHSQYRSDRKESRIEAMQQVGRTTAALIDGVTGDLESFALSTAITLGDANISTNPADSERLQPTVGPYLQHLMDSYGILRAIFITDPNGIVALSNAGSNGADVSDRTYIKALQDGAEDFWSEGFPGSQSGVTTVAYSRQITGPNGDIRGFLVIALWPRELAARLPPNLLADGHVTLVDRDGGLLFQLPDDSENAIAPDFGEWPDMIRSATGEELVATSSSVPLVQGDRYGSLVGLDRAGWVLGYSLPSGVIEGNANSLFQRDLLVISAVLLLGLGAMVVIANRLTRPLARLTAAAAAIGRGESTEVLSELHTSDADVAVLASTMSQMQTGIETRQRRLLAQAAVIESIERMGESLASELELDRLIEAIADSGLDLTEAEAAIILHGDEIGEKSNFLEPTKARRHLVIPSASPFIQDVMTGTFDTSLADVEAGQLSPDNQATTDLPGSVMGIPIRRRDGSVQAGLFLLHSRPNAFTGQHQRLAAGLARWASIVMENARLYGQSQEMLNQVQKTNDDKDEFLAMVSHELRTPITTIYGGTRLLRMRRAQLSEEAIGDMITSVAEEAERLYRLVEDLLAIARTEMTDGVEREPVSVVAVVEQARSQLGRISNREVIANISDDLPAALAEPTYLVHVIYNLISNADKYAAAGPPIEVEASVEDSELVVRVLDRGPGVAEAQLALIFDSFYRTKDASERASGKGLGLTVCKRLVEALSGRIWAANRPGGGLVVAFALEVAQTAGLESVTSDA